MSVNRISGYFAKMPRPKVVSDVAARNAKVLRDFIRSEGPGKDKDVASIARISPTKLSQLTNQGFETPIPSVRAVCRALRIDVDALCQGEIVRIGETLGDPELVRLARQLVGTASGTQATSMLRHLLELESRANAHRHT